MRFVPSDYIIDGMILGKTLFNENGQVLLMQGVMLNAHYIKRIQDIGYNGVYIEDDLSKEIEIKEILGTELRNKVVTNIKETFLSIQSNKTPGIENIANSAESIVEELLENKNLMVNMIDLKVFDDYTFYHSVNVAVLSTILGIAMKLNRDQLSKLCLAGLLHDIGKVFVPKEILMKSGKLTEEEAEIVRAHSEKGFEYIKNVYDLSATTYIGILQHHERWDGSGYPGQMKERAISLFGRILAIVDAYDALTSDRPFRKALPPSEAMEYILGAGGSIFDIELVTQFSRKVAPYPVGTCVALSDGRTGIVMENFEDCCIRPVVKVLSHNNEHITPYTINLRDDFNNMHTTITGITNFVPEAKI